jgi:hypothetical protein
MSREYFKGEREEQRAYSRAVKVRGGTTVYLAGIGAPVDAQGHSLAGNFTAQTRLCTKSPVRSLTRRSIRTFWSHSGCLLRPESSILAIKSTAMEHFLCKASWRNSAKLWRARPMKSSHCFGSSGRSY